MARRGAAVHVVERDRIGAGSSGGHVGALAPHAPENWNDKKQVQLDSLLMAEAFWRGVEAASGLPSGYARGGRLQPLAEGADDRIRARIEAAALRWPAGTGMRILDDPGAGPALLSPSGRWLWDGLTARIGPRPALAALAAAIRKAGGRITEGAEPRPEDGPVLWATGAPGLAELGQAMGRPVGSGVKGQSLLLDFAAPDAPQIFAEGLHVVPHADGTTAIGSTSETEFDHDRPDERAGALLERARALCPALRDAPVIESWAGIRPRARSRAPLLGAWPGRPGHYVANGGFKIGFGMAPAVARIMADLILDGKDAIPEGFRLA